MDDATVGPGVTAPQASGSTAAPDALGGRRRSRLRRGPARKDGQSRATSQGREAYS
jgi:hypothetical protein